MKKLPPFFILTIALFLALPSTRAHIGETPEQCDTRYGAPVKVEQETDKHDAYRAYLKSGFIIIALFHQGICDLVAFQKQERDALHESAEISTNEINILLKSNGENSPWIKGADGMHTVCCWNTENGKISATYDSIQSHCLNIVTSDYLKRQDEKRKSEEAKNLKWL